MKINLNHKQSVVLKPPKINLLTWLEIVILVGVWLFSLLGQWQRFLTPIGTVGIHEALMFIYIFFLLPISVTGLFTTRESNPKKLLEIKEALSHKLFFYWVFVFIAWLCWIIASSLINYLHYPAEYNILVGGSYLARQLIYWLFLAVLAYRVKNQLIFLPNQKPLKPLHFKNALLFWLVFQIILGIAQYLMFPDARWLYYLGWDDHLNRAFGTLLDPGYFGLLMSLGALIIWSDIADQKFSSLNWQAKSRAMVVLAGFILLLALSFSRASYLAYLAGVAVLAWKFRQRTLLLGIPLLLLALVLVPKDGGGEGQKLLRTASIEQRTETTAKHWWQYRRRQQWLIGQGWYYQLSTNNTSQNNLKLPQHASTVDTAYLHLLFSSGVIGLTLWLILIIIWWQIFRDNPVVLAGLTAVLTHSLFSPAMFYPWVWLAMGVLILSQINISKKEDKNY